MNCTEVGVVVEMELPFHFMARSSDKVASGSAINCHAFVTRVDCKTTKKNIQFVIKGQGHFVLD